MALCIASGKMMGSYGVNAVITCQSKHLVRHGPQNTIDQTQNQICPPRDFLKGLVPDPQLINMKFMTRDMVRHTNTCAACYEDDRLDGLPKQREAIAVPPERQLITSTIRTFCF